MSRIQLTIFSVLVILSVIFIALNEKTDLIVCNRLSQVMLFPVKVVFGYLQFLSVSKTRIEDLETMLSRLKMQNEELKSRLYADTLQDQAITEFRLLKANIIGRDPADFNGYLYIDKGQTDSVYVNQPVVLRGILIGKIKTVSEHVSVIETFEKPGFAISAVDANTGINGIARQSRELFFDYIKITDPITVGDSIFTSGLSEVFPKGILIGMVKDIEETSDLLFKTVTITPSIQINRISYVFLVCGPGLTMPVIGNNTPLSIPSPLSTSGNEPDTNR